MQNIFAGEYYWLICTGERNFNLREFACELTSSWPQARVLVWFRFAVMTPDCRGKPGKPGQTGIRARVPNRAFYMIFTVLGDFGALSCNVFLTFSWQLRTERLLLRPFLDDGLPKTLSKSMMSRETSLQKSKKRWTIALAALGGWGGLGQLWEALAELWEALEKLW